jgi:general secretion pathway protein D
MRRPGTCGIAAMACALALALLCIPSARAGEPADAPPLPPEVVAMPPGGRVPPPDETPPPPTETTAPPEETTAPPTETTAPPEETTAPPTETTAPPEETTAPPTEVTAPPEENPAPPTEVTAPPEETPVVPKPTPPKEDMIKLGDQKGTSIPRVIEMIAKDLKVNFLMPEQLTGTVTIRWNRDLPKSEALEILRTILDDEGYALIEGKHFIRVVQKGPNVASAPTDVVVVRGEQAVGETEKQITAIVVLNYIEANDAFQVLSQLRDRTALIAMLPGINAIIIKDSEARVRYLMDIVEKLDVPGTTGIVTVVRIEYAEAGKLAKIINDVISAGKGPSPIGATEEVPGVPMPSGGLAQQPTGIKIIPDERLNSLIIVASERETEQVLDLIKKLDVQPPEGIFPIHTFQCKNQKAATLASVLTDFAQRRPPVQPTAEGPAVPGATGKESEVFFIADETTNKILVSASALDWEIYQQLLQELDLPQPQVLVEVWVVELSSNDQFNLGIEWQTRGPSGDARVGPSRQEIFGGTSVGVGLGDVFAGNGFNRGLNVAVRSMTNTRVTIGGKTYIIPDVDAYLKALSEVTKVNVLSSPKLLTLNNEAASVDVTDQIFISKSQITGTGLDQNVTETFDTQDVGIKLNFTPQINADGFVIMDVDLSVSSVVGAAITEAGSRPVIAQRETKNKVRVENGNTIIISGLRRHDKSKSVARVPVLGRIPLVGLLFRSTTVIDLQTNLMIFITPHIVTDTPEMQAVSDQIQGQDLDLERPRFEIDPKRWRQLQRQEAHEAGEHDTGVWQR